MDECIHGLGPVASCTICNGREAKERAKAKSVDYSFTAKFDGPLACGHGCDLGETIYRMLDGRIICADCAT